LSHTDLSFLYEVPKPFEGSGEDLQSLHTLRKERNPHEDMLMVFRCTEREIAHSVAEINESTKAYVGKLQPNIFTLLPEGIEYVYTSFPEGCIRREQVEVGGSSVIQLETEMEKKNIKTEDGGLMASEEFKQSIYKEEYDTGGERVYNSLKSPEHMHLIRLTVGDLGFPDGATIEDIFIKAIALGLELCPPEVGPYYRLHYTNQPMNEYVYIGMEPIAGRGGGPYVFDVLRVHGDALGRRWAGPGNRWDADFQFVFRVRPAKPGKQVNP
ncbi:MAG: hypothetical protein AAB448_03010, partial [Patescibacteria group bacterium]